MLMFITYLNNNNINIILPIVSSIPPNYYIFYLNNLASSGGYGSFNAYKYYIYFF